MFLHTYRRVRIKRPPCSKHPPQDAMYKPGHTLLLGKPLQFKPTLPGLSHPSQQEAGLKLPHDHCSPAVPALARGRPPRVCPSWGNPGIVTVTRESSVRRGLSNLVTFVLLLFRLLLGEGCSSTAPETHP